MNYEPKISAGAGVAQPLGCSTCYGSCTGYCKGGCYKDAMVIVQDHARTQMQAVSKS